MQTIWFFCVFLTLFSLPSLYSLPLLNTCSYLQTTNKATAVNGNESSLLLCHSLSPCLIHCSLVFRAQLTPGKYWLIWFPQLPGSRNYFTPYLLSTFHIYHFFPLWKAVVACCNSHYLSSFAYFSAMPFCSKLADASQSFFSPGKENCRIKENSSCYDMCVKDLNQQP